MSAPRGDADGAPEETPDGDPPAPHALRVTVATDQTGAPLPRLSTLAAHTRAVMADPRAALPGIVPTSRAVNPQEDDRVTLMGRLDSDPDPYLRAGFLVCHPCADIHGGHADFAEWRMTVSRMRRVSGFGAAARTSNPRAMMVEPTLAGGAAT